MKPTFPHRDFRFGAVSEDPRPVVNPGKTQDAARIRLTGIMTITENIDMSDAVARKIPLLAEAVRDFTGDPKDALLTDLLTQVEVVWDTLAVRNVLRPDQTGDKLQKIQSILAPVFTLAEAIANSVAERLLFYRDMMAAAALQYAHDGSIALTDFQFTFGLECSTRSARTGPTASVKGRTFER